VIGMWVSTVVLIPIGAFLVVSVARDSLRINPRFISKIAGLFKRKKHSDSVEEG
ncbi:MAG: hypothetical protein HUK15_04995, partial [Bacteroidales bacterium]|nr:hypothetical protein [Bacteroidales bacterium]